MPVLGNIKYEKLAQLYVDNDGKLTEDVIAEIGYASASLKYTRQLIKRPLLSARILELQRAAASKTVMQLSERLELLTEMARDKETTKETRRKLIAEIHKMSGDDVQQIHVDSNVRTEDIIRFVDISLPDNQRN